VQAAAKTIVQPDKEICVIEGDRAKIEPVIRELNLGEVKILSPQGKILQ
jgi:hypothetical protein